MFELLSDLNQEKETIKQELSEILAKYYDGSFARMVGEYIHATGMTEAFVCLTK